MWTIAKEKEKEEEEEEEEEKRSSRNSVKSQRNVKDVVERGGITAVKWLEWNPKGEAEKRDNSKTWHVSDVKSQQQLY